MGKIYSISFYAVCEARKRIVDLGPEGPLDQDLRK